jgi:hypothetical protein
MAWREGFMGSVMTGIVRDFQWVVG